MPLLSWVQLLYGRAKTTVTARIKRSGWALFILGILWEIPEWKHKIYFWLDAVEDMGGFPGWIAGIFVWPYFRYLLIVGGLAYVLFVGEPKRMVQHHPWWPYVGWSIFAICLIAIITTAGYGYFEVRVREVARSPEQLTSNQVDALEIAYSKAADSFDKQYATSIR
jgi:hypothetical protein